MPMSQMLLPEFDMEMAKTRVALERIPEDKFAWRPHEKSMSLGRLAGHLAEMLGWAGAVVGQGSFDISPPGATPYLPPQLNTRRDVLELFDRNTASARTAIAGVSD